MDEYFALESGFSPDHPYLPERDDHFFMLQAEYLLWKGYVIGMSVEELAIKLKEKSNIK